MSKVRKQLVDDEGQIPGSAGFQAPVSIDPSLPDIPNLFPASLTGAGTRGSANAKFIPVDPNAIERLAVQFDTRGYNLSDADWANRFPELPAGRAAGISSAVTNIEGKPDPYVQSEMQKAGLGDINLGTNEFQQARNLGVGILNKQNRDRNYFARLLADNPHRALGLNSTDIAHIALANTGGANAFAQAQFGSRLNQYQSNVNQQIQNQAAIIGGIGKIGGAAISNPTVNQYLNPTNYSGYGNSAMQDYSLATQQFGQGNVGYNAAGDPIDATTGAGLDTSGGI